MNAVTKIINRSSKHTPSMTLVLRGANVIGILTKYKNTKWEKNPYKAYRGMGNASAYLGSFYGLKGRREALEAIYSENLTH